MLLVAVALATSAIAASDLPTSEITEIAEIAFEDVLIETAPALVPSPLRVRQVADDDELLIGRAAIEPPPASIFRPPRST